MWFRLNDDLWPWLDYGLARAEVWLVTGVLTWVRARRMHSVRICPTQKGVMRMKKWQAVLTQSATMVLSRSVALATTSGSTLPWDQPLITVSDALWGTPAHAIMTAVIVFAGLAWAFTDHQIGARRVFAGAMGGALAVNAPQVMTALGWGAALS
jgi:type IV secretory pathway VirB2 component (pilin)